MQKLNPLPSLCHTLPQLRSKSRPTPEETEWLCHQLKTKNKLIAYREARNVISGDYFDGK